MENLDQVALNNIAIGLDIPELLNLCESNKKFYRLICSQDYIWKYNLNKYFSDELSNDFREMSKLKSPKELFQLLFSLKRLKQKLNLEDTLFQLYNRKKLRLTKLELEFFPKNIFILINLEILSLKHNMIKEIPKEIGNLINLQNLNLERNHIKAIPKEIGNLTKLESLNLSNNEIKEIPKEIANLTNLENLYLDINKIKVIPEELGNLLKLKNLYLHGNAIKKIPPKLKKIVSLEKRSRSYSYKLATQNLKN